MGFNWLGLRCFHTSIFIETPSLEGLPTKAKEDPSPHEMRLCPAGHQPSISWSWGELLLSLLLLLLLLFLLLLLLLLCFFLPQKNHNFNSAKKIYCYIHVLFLHRMPHQLLYRLAKCVIFNLLSYCKAIVQF